MIVRALLVASLLAFAQPASALTILLSNDDGLTSNLVALYTVLKAAGHDVIVSVPCTGQSGRGAAIVMYSTDTLVATNDSQIARPRAAATTARHCSPRRRSGRSPRPVSPTATLLRARHASDGDDVQD